MYYTFAMRDSLESNTKKMKFFVLLSLAKEWRSILILKSIKSFKFSTFPHIHVTYIVKYIHMEPHKICSLFTHTHTHIIFIFHRE